MIFDSNSLKFHIFLRPKFNLVPRYAPDERQADGRGLRSGAATRRRGSTIIQSKYVVLTFFSREITISIRFLKTKVSNYLDFVKGRRAATAAGRRAAHEIADHQGVYRVTWTEGDRAQC